MYQARYRFTKRNDGTDVPGMIQVLEQGGEVPNLLSRAPTAPVNQGYAHSLIGNLASLRASLTYVTGAHNMRFGYQGGFGNPSQTYNYPNQITQIRMRDGVPNQLTQTVGRWRPHQVRPQSHPDQLLRAGPVDDQPADRYRAASATTP